MRSRLAWVVGGLGVAGAFALRALRREVATTPAAEPVSGPDGRADELRRKLDESRSLVEERDAFEAGETTVDEAEPAPAATPDDRRRHVHERAKASVERMQRSSPGEEG